MSIEQITIHNQAAFKKVSRGGPTVLEYAREHCPGKYYASYALGERNYAIVCYDTMQAFVNKVFELSAYGRADIHYFENLPADPEVLRREAYDIDIKYSEISAEEKAYLDRGIGAFLTDFVRLRNDYLETVRDEWSAELKPILAEDMVVLEACNNKKFSLHILAPNKHDVGFTKEQVKVWQTDFNVFLEGREAFIRVDVAAMSRTGHMRTVHSSKPSDPERKLKIYQEGAAVTRAEYFVCFHPRDRPKLASVDSRPMTVQSRANLEDIGDAKDDIETYLGRYSEFKVTQKGDKPEWRLDRMESAVCRVNAQAFHDSDGLLAFVNSKGSLSLHCPRCVMTVTVDQHFGIVIPRKIPQVQPLKSRTHFMKKGDYVHNNQLLFDLISERDTVYNACSTGMGKTFTAINAARRLGCKNVLYIHHRISLDDDLTSSYGLHSYRDNRALTEGGIVSCCLNSLFGTLHRHFGSISNVDLFIIDEIRSVQRQTKMEGQVQNTKVLLDILRCGRKLLIMDACMRDDDIQFINSLRPADGTHSVVGDEVREPIFGAEIVEIRSDLQSAFFAEMAAHDFSRGGAVVLYNTSIEKMQAVLQKLEVDFIHINQHTRAGIDLSPENLSRYKLIAVSPTISEGVSFDSELFSGYSGYGCFQNGPNMNCAQAETCFQMCRRFRRVMSYKILIKSIDFYPRFANERSYMRVFQLNRLYTLNVDLSSPEWRFCSRVDIEGEKQRASFTDSITQFLVNNCFDVSFGEQDVFSSGEEAAELRGDVRDLTRRKYETMATFGRLSDEEARALKTNAETKEDYIKLEKHYIERALRMVTTEGSADVLQYYGCSRLRLKATVNLRNLMRFNSSTGELEESERAITRIENSKREDYYQLVDFSAQKRFFFSQTPLIFRYIYEVVLALGWRGFFDTSPRDLLDLTGFKAYLEENYERISYCTGTSRSQKAYERIVSSDKETLKYIRALLFKLGISLIQFRGSWRMVSLLKHISPNGFKEDHVNFDLPNELGFTEEFFLGDKTFVCPHCNCDFPAEKYDKHTGACKPKPKRQKVSYGCGICGEEFTDKSKHARHEKSHEQKQKRAEKQADDKVCPHCSKELSSRRNRDNHMVKCASAPK